LRAINQKAIARQVSQLLTMAIFHQSVLANQHWRHNNRAAKASLFINYAK
jgi:hypothetical protein